jgi:hypothetical protein
MAELNGELRLAEKLPSRRVCSHFEGDGHFLEFRLRPVHATS